MSTETPPDCGDMTSAMMTLHYKEQLNITSLLFKDHIQVQQEKKSAQMQDCQRKFVIFFNRD